MRPIEKQWVGQLCDPSQDPRVDEAAFEVAQEGELLS
jgi:hypothetical protein